MENNKEKFTETQQGGPMKKPIIITPTPEKIEPNKSQPKKK
jgi:hypothetical protein